LLGGEGTDLGGAFFCGRFLSSDAHPLGYARHLHSTDDGGARLETLGACFDEIEAHQWPDPALAPGVGGLNAAAKSSKGVVALPCRQPRSRIGTNS
jgi:hypothetical protein